MPTPERRRELADNAIARRADLGRKKKCINGAHHGKATHGRRCAWCAMVRNRGLKTTLVLEALGQAPKRPRGYVPRPRSGTFEDNRASRYERNNYRRSVVGRREQEIVSDDDGWLR